MAETYMDRVVRTTPTRFWVNNPTGEELRLAVEAGALSGTTNPTYGANLLRREPAYIEPIVRAAVREAGDDSEAADLAYRRITDRFMKAFLPTFRRTGGQHGFVTMQDDPRRDADPQLIVKAAERHARVGPNYMAKIPVIRSGMDAMAELVRQNVPICATECFALAQTIAMCDLYERTAAECGHSPPFYITHITGIFDEELQDYVTRNRVKIAPERLRLAGAIVARKEYLLLKERGYRTVMLGGGARGVHHFTEFVGGDLHITMNWSTIRELNDANAEVVRRIDVEDPADLIEELSEKLPDFRRAYQNDGLEVEEFESFPPLLRFRNMFIQGCDALLDAVKRCRAEKPVRRAKAPPVKKPRP